MLENILKDSLQNTYFTQQFRAPKVVTWVKNSYKLLILKIVTDNRSMIVFGERDYFLRS